MFNFLDINKQSILKEGNPILREKSLDVKFPLSQSNESLINRMKKYLIESNDERLAVEKNLEPAVGIAAPQIGNNLNIFLLAYEDDDENTYTQAYINPKVVGKSKELSFLESGEGCLSVPEKLDGYVYRSAKIKVEYYDETGTKYQEELEGFYAIAFQHEYDHLQGKLYIDYINKENPYLEKKDAVKI